MQPTFGDFDDRARSHLTNASSHTTDLHGDARAWAEWHDCLTAADRLVVLAAYGTQGNRDRLSPTASCGRRLHAQVGVAHASLACTPLPSRADASQVSQSLAQATRDMGAAADLLASHTLDKVGVPTYLDDFASLIDSETARADLLGTAGARIMTLADIALDLPPTPSMQRVRIARALQPLRDSAKDATDRLPSVAVLRNVPLAQPLARLPVDAHESPHALLTNAVHNAEQLHLMSFQAAAERRPGQLTVGVLGNIATTLAAVHHSSSRILAAYPSSMADDPHRNVADDSRTTAALYMDLRQGWQGISGTVDHGPSAPARLEAGDLMLRIGRLAHGDDWQPRVGGGAAMRPIADIAEGVAGRAGLLEGLHQLATMSSLIAGEHALIVPDLRSSRQLLVPTSTLPPSDLPERPWSKASDETVERLVDSYRRVRDSALLAAAGIESLAGLTHEPTALRDRITLAAIRGRRTVPRQAEVHPSSWSRTVDSTLADDPTLHR